MSKPTGEFPPHPLILNEEWLRAFVQRVLSPDLDSWMAHHASWGNNKLLIEGKSNLRGNLAEDFANLLMARFFGDKLRIQVTSVSTEAGAAERAARLTLLSEQISSVVQLNDVIKKAFHASAWAPFSWICLRHKLDPFHYEQIKGHEAGSFEDGYVGVAPEMLSQSGIDLSQIRLANEPMRLVEDDTSPLLSFPILENVDPRSVIYGPYGPDIDPSRAEYFARFSVLTLKEAQAKYGDDKVAEEHSLGGQGVTLFSSLNGELDRSRYPKMVLVAEVHLLVDRNNPELQDQIFHVLLGSGPVLLAAYSNPVPRLVRYFPVSMTPNNPSPDSSTLAGRLYTFAAMYDHCIDNLDADIARAGQVTDLYSPQLGISHEEATKAFTDPSSHRVIPVSDVNGHRRLFFEPRQSVIQALLLVKTLAQQSTKTSDLDRGQAIRNITNQQINTLVDATSINLSPVLTDLQRTIAKVVVSCMYLMRYYRSTIDFESDEATRDPLGELQMYLSEVGRIRLYGFDIDLRAPYGEAGETQQLMSMQLLKVVQQLASMPQFAEVFSSIDLVELVKEVVLQVTGGQGFHILRPSSDALKQSLSTPLAPGGAPGETIGTGQPEGEHPERLLGSRGVDMGNALRGAAQTGEERP